MASENARSIKISEDLYNKISEISERSGASIRSVGSALVYTGLSSAPNNRNKNHSQVVRWTRFINSITKGV